MTETDDDPIGSWNERVFALRKRGRASGAALTVIPAGEIDVRQVRPAAPERLSQPEKDFWERLTLNRRPGRFSGAEEVPESCVTRVRVQQLEAALRKAKPGTGVRYTKLARMHRQSVALAAALAVRLRLRPSTKLDRRTPQDRELPVA